MRRLILTAGLTLFSCGAATAQTDTSAVLETYADMALAMFEDAFETAQDLDQAIDQMIANPSPETLNAARLSWQRARVPYQQTEGYRFGNVAVDEWEGRVNAWPLDEGLIDYVESAYYGQQSDENQLSTANVIANEQLVFGGTTIDASLITPALLSGSLHEADRIEANVATGYHAIEFLLWGQDLNGTDAGAGNRPYTDFDTANCTGGHCDRRIAYLEATSALLLTDLTEMVEAWGTDGGAREAATLSSILMGLGSLSYGELAGERMQLGLLVHDPEEEHDCFSDNTHYSHYYDQVGMMAIYRGSYRRINGRVVAGPSLADLVTETDPNLSNAIQTAMTETLRRMDVMVARAEGGEAYDQMIGEGNEEGNHVVQRVVDALVVQAQGFEAAIAALGLEGIEIEGSDSLDSPSAIFE